MAQVILRDYFWQKHHVNYYELIGIGTCECLEKRMKGSWNVNQNYNTHTVAQPCEQNCIIKF